MFKTRLISGIILVIIAVLTITAGGTVLCATLYLVSMIGLLELYRVFHIHNKLLGEVGYLVNTGYYILMWMGLEVHFITPLVIGLLMALLVVFVFAFPEYRAEQVLAAFFGVFYVGIMLSYVYKTRALADGVFIVWLIFICSWICDTCAYCVGVLLGKHKLAPKLSPKKSIEGSIGGILGAALIGVIYAFLIKNRLVSIKNPYLACAVICALGAVISQLGDLAASGIKRNYDVKDYGKLIPGHGGILDRFDSVIFTAPGIYFLALLFL